MLDDQHDSEYQRAILTIIGEQSHELAQRSRELRARAREAVQWSRRLRDRCAPLSERVAAVLQGAKQ